MKLYSKVILLALVFVQFNVKAGDAPDKTPEMLNKEVVDTLDLRNPRQAISGIISGGQPTKQDFKTLAKNGVKTVINLRTSGEFDGFDEAGLAKSLGMKHQVFEISGRSGITRENAERLDKLLKQSDGPVLLHCGSGNRVGALLALRAFYVQGKPAEESIAIGKAAGMTRLSGKVEKILLKK